MRPRPLAVPIAASRTAREKRSGIKNPAPRNVGSFRHVERVEPSDRMDGYAFKRILHLSEGVTEVRVCPLLEEAPLCALSQDAARLAIPRTLPDINWRQERRLH
jgi:hypothetical protein